MTLETFFAIQRGRVQKVDDTPADLAVRKLRFKNAEGNPKDKNVPDPSFVNVSGYDGIKRGYTLNRIIYL